MYRNLEDLQQTFVDALLNIQSVEPALAIFKGSRDLNRQRFAFYRGNSIAIWQQACANAYPVLQQIVGEDFFRDLTRAYGLAHAPQSGNLAEFGASLPSYISTLENCRNYPYLADVAKLEWQVHRAYYLKQADPITLAELNAFPAERWPLLRVKLQDCCALLESPWAVAEIWLAHQKTDTPLPQTLAATNYCLVWRHDFNITVNSISAASYYALQALSRGEPLEQALECALEKDPEFAIETELTDWFDKQLFCEISL